MSLKKYIGFLLIAAIFFVAGVLVGRFVMPRTIEITVIDIKELVEVIERYNKAKYEFDKIKTWNEDAVIGLEPEN